MAKLRLVKVLLQPVFVLDDGDTLKPVVYVTADGQPTEHHTVVEVPADEWAVYSGTTFPAGVKEWEKQINADLAAAKPNRAQRRAKPKR